MNGLSVLASGLLAGVLVFGGLWILIAGHQATLAGARRRSGKSQRRAADDASDSTTDIRHAAAGVGA
ncbi:MAG TPA: hypothetical protein VIN32_03355 [Candidatus Limnocylindria bacterium]